MGSVNPYANRGAGLGAMNWGNDKVIFGLNAFQAVALGAVLWYCMKK